MATPPGCPTTDVPSPELVLKLQLASPALLPKKKMSPMSLPSIVPKVSCQARGGVGLDLHHQPAIDHVAGVPHDLDAIRAAHAAADADLHVERRRGRGPAFGMVGIAAGLSLILNTKSLAEMPA